MRDWAKWENRVIVRGQGFYLIDASGKKYLDGTASMWCNVWGHGKNEVVEAMREQLKSLQHSTLFGLANESSTRLGAKMVKIARGMEKVFYTDNGSTAIEAAMKMALQYWLNKGRPEKKEFLALDHGYHGDTVGAMSLGYVERFFGAYKPLLAPKVHRLPSPKLYRSGFDSHSALVEHCIERTENVLRNNASRCAALVIESGAQIAGGAIVYPAGYQRNLSDLCEKYNVLLILDEIATGFGRLGNMVEYVAQRSSPDIVCFGKALTGGYFPLAVTMATKGVFDAFLGDYSQNKQLYHGHTFTGHPVGCAADLANIELYKKRGLVQQIRESGKYVAARLREFRTFDIAADVRQKGLLAGIELALDGKPVLSLRNGEKIGYFIMQESLKRGVHLRPLGNIMMVIPPLAIDMKNLKKLMDTHLEILEEVTRLLP
jgi:adenosylmethionine-8-amino-7-oxononanoate aminotransferase